MMATRRYGTTLLALALLLVLTIVPLVVHGDADHPTVINLYPDPDGPQPSPLTVAAGTAVLWVSHLAPTKLVVVTVSFPEGQRVAQATTAVEGYNRFALEGQHFVGRLEGSGGKVALRFLTPGAYAYTIDHQGHLTGTIVVQK